MSSGMSAKKLKERLDRKKRYQIEKDYKNAVNGPPTSDEALAKRQHAFCVKVINGLLEESHALSFSKPVTELWDVEDLPGYFDKVKKPMDLGTVQENLDKETFISAETKLFDFTLFADDTRLVFENCISYNSAGTELAKLAKKYLQQFDKEIHKIPVPREAKTEPGTPDKSRGGESDADQESSDEGVARDPARKARSRANRDASSGDASSDLSDDGEEEGDNDPLPKLKRKQGNLEQLKARAQGTLDELDMERNVPMTAEERVLLRDQVEAAPWEKVDKVVGILKKYVDAAVSDMGKGADPEYVTLELNDVEPHLLRDVEAIVNPCSRRDLEVKKIDKIDGELKDINRRIRELKRSGSNSASRKKKRRR